MKSEDKNMYSVCVKGIFNLQATTLYITYHKGAISANFSHELITNKTILLNNVLLATFWRIQNDLNINYCTIKMIRLLSKVTTFAM